MVFRWHGQQFRGMDTIFAGQRHAISAFESDSTNGASTTIHSAEWRSKFHFINCYCFDLYLVVSVFIACTVHTFRIWYLLWLFSTHILTFDAVTDMSQLQFEHRHSVTYWMHSHLYLFLAVQCLVWSCCDYVRSERSAKVISRCLRKCFRIDKSWTRPRDSSQPNHCRWVGFFVVLIVIECSFSMLLSGGFSMGGALAIHTGYHVNRELGGVFVCSGFLNNNSIVYESLKSMQANPDEKKNLPPLIMYHGERDSLVPCEWGKRTYDQLTSFGVKGEFIPLKNAMHELKTNEILEIQEWIANLLPPLDTDLANKLWHATEMRNMCGEICAVDPSVERINLNE